MNPYTSTVTPAQRGKNQGTLRGFAWGRLSLALIGIPLVGYASDFVVLVITNVLGGPYMADSVPTPNHQYWWGIRRILTPWIAASTALLTLLAVCYVIVPSKNRVGGSFTNPQSS